MSFLDVLARLLDAAELLDPAERDAVLGDFAETNETGMRAVLDLAGLVVRRQAALWKHWKPWLGAIAVALPAGLLLSTASQWLASRYDLYSWIARNYRVIDPATLAENGLSLDRGILQIGRASLVLLAWTFTSGFTIGLLSRRATWPNALLFSAALLSGPLSAALREQSLDPITGATFAATVAVTLITVMLGMRLSRRPALHPAVRTLLWVAAVVTALATPGSFWFPMSTGWRAGLLLAAYGPVVYLTSASVWAF